MKKKTGKSKAGKMRDLPRKSLNANTAKSVKGGATSEHVSLSFAKVNVEYKPQKGDGS